MRKRLINQHLKNLSDDQSWMDLQQLAQVELTSEDPAYPIEAALSASTGEGWRAAESGKQTIRFLFDEAQKINRIQLVFCEQEYARTQEFLLRSSPDRGYSYREIVRQQYNFAPPGVTDEFEDYAVDLVGVTVLELTIVPDISGGDARASMRQARIA
jgi:hypothetical protein